MASLALALQAMFLGLVTVGAVQPASHPEGICPCGHLEHGLHSLTLAVRNLSSRVTDLEAEHSGEHSASTEENGDTEVLRKCDNLEVFGCTGMKYSDLHTALDATQTLSGPGRLCRVVSTVDVPDLSAYTFTVSLYNRDSRNGANFGHPGIAFNVLDRDNFDLVYFRPHQSPGLGCVQHAYLNSGSIQFTSEASCDGAPVTGDTWFQAKVEAQNGQASVYIDGHLVNTVSTHYPSESGVGVLTFEDYGNIIYFKDAVLGPLSA